MLPQVGQVWTMHAGIVRATVLAINGNEVTWQSQFMKQPTTGDVEVFLDIFTPPRT